MPPEIIHYRLHCSVCQQSTWYSATRTRFWHKACIWRGTQQSGWQTNFQRKVGQSMVLICCWESCGTQAQLTEPPNTTTGSYQSHHILWKKLSILFAFSSTSAEYLQKVDFLISQGSVATCLRWDGWCSIGFIANFIRFTPVQKFFQNQSRFDNVTESLNVGTFLRNIVYKS